MTPQKDFVPPEPVGQPYRADPSDPFPFPTETDAPAAQLPSPDLPDVPRWSRPPSYSPELQPGAGGEQLPTAQPGTPQFRQPGQNEATKPKAEVSGATRHARIAIWIGIASFLVAYTFIGAISIVMGASAMQRGEKKLGLWAVWIGVASVLFGISIYVLSATGVLSSLEDALRELQDDLERQRNSR